MAKRIVVIGAGVIGAAVAAALAARGAKVTVLNKGRLGDCTSSVSFAWLNALQKFPIEYINLNVMGMRRHAEYAAKHGSAPWYHPGGNLEWASGDAAQAALADVVRKMQEVGYDARWIGKRELGELEPEMDLRAVTAKDIAYYPDECWIEAPVLLARLLADARAAGAMVRAQAEVVGFAMAGDRIAGVRLAGGEEVGADLVVNCAGPGAARVARLAGTDVPMKNEVGVLAYTEPTAVYVGRMVHAPEIAAPGAPPASPVVAYGHIGHGPGLSLRPDGGGRLCLHNHDIDKAVTERADGTYAFDPAALSPLVAMAETLYPGLAGIAVEATRIGVRPIPVDRRPVVGHMPGVANLYTCVMHSGITQCLWMGELVSREVMGDIETDELARFRPTRFGAKELAAE
jgi:glycine/D-amino acid oxidase-like deaminating enzyme